MRKIWMGVGLPMLFALGCAAETMPVADGEPEPPVDTSVSPYARHAPGPPNPCVTGMTLRSIDGRAVHVPVPCTHDVFLDPSDPPPDEELIDPIEEPVADQAMRNE